jgi:hypothetical protein
VKFTDKEVVDVEFVDLKKADLNLVVHFDKKDVVVIVGIVVGVGIEVGTVVVEVVVAVLHNCFVLLFVCEDDVVELDSSVELGN